MDTKIRVAFIKFGGMSAGGTEKFLQVLAANLPRDRFEVDFYYCDTAKSDVSRRHPDTDPTRIEFMKSSGVRLIKFSVDEKDPDSPIHEWTKTDFWEKFDERNYDIIQTGRGGYPEYPFTEIRKTPIVDSLHLLAGIDNQYNISRVLHISRWSANQWISQGGDAKRVEVISTFISIPDKPYANLRSKLNIEGKFVFGFHQRKDDWIYSLIPLEAYKKVESDNTVFILLNGSDLYKQQAQRLGIRNIIFLPYAETQDDLYEFVTTLDVFAHGRKDGEVNSSAMAEAMYFGLPIVSHTSSYSNGHVENVADAGRVVENAEEYAQELRRLLEDAEYYKSRSKRAAERFAEMYDLRSQVHRITAIYEDVLRNPFPNKARRVYFDILNRIRKTVRNRYTRKAYRFIRSKLRK